MMKLGFIGSGFISKFHANAIQQVRGLDIGGILRRGGAEDLASYCQKKGLGDAVLYNSIAEMAKNVDVLAIYTPNYVRIDIMEEIVNAVKAGAQLKGVICEKPLGRNMVESRKLVQLAEDANLLTAYFENQIFMKAINSQRQQLIAIQRKMGPLSFTRCSEEHAGPHENWFWDPIRLGGGVLSDMGCHSIAVGRYALTPEDKDLFFLKPQSVMADVGLLKWGQPQWRDKLKNERGVDYLKAPAEDFVTGIITYRNPDTGQLVKSQFTNSWIFEKQGLRLFMDGMGPGYAFEVNTLESPLNIFVGDDAAEAIKDQEKALEKATASRGLLAIQYNEADLYGYTDENQDMFNSFSAGKNGFLTWKYGLEITRLVMACYLSAERKKTINLTDPIILQELETYIPAIQQGKGVDQLF